MKAVAHEITVYPTADAAVYLTYSSPWWQYENFGSETVLATQFSSSLIIARSFLKFDLSAYPEGTIINATLNIKTGEVSSGTTSYLHDVVSSIWEEDTITWDNQPIYGDLITTKSPSAESWTEWNVTDWAISKIDTFGSMIFKVEESGADKWVDYYSREHENQPYLTLYVEGYDWAFVDTWTVKVGNYELFLDWFSVDVWSVKVSETFWGQTVDTWQVIMPFYGPVFELLTICFWGLVACVLICPTAIAGAIKHMSTKYLWIAVISGFAGLIFLIILIS
ncbi:hypothetical protein ES703_91872 [subsurface metagenome]